MVKETTIIGSLGVLLGILSYLKTAEPIGSFVFLVLGLLMILFGRNENKIEERKDG